MRALVALLMLLCATSARAETLIVSLSAHTMRISQNFEGGTLVLFGAIERDSATVSRAGTYDVSVAVHGPEQTFVVREKQPTIGLWINRDSRSFVRQPGYYFSAMSRGLIKSVDESLLKRERIGLASLGQEAMGGDIPFAQALIRANERKRLYGEAPNGVTFLAPNLFRATIALPSNTPLGDYEVRVHLFSGGALLTRTTTNFEVTKVGFEALVARLSQRHGLFYAAIALALALLTGWLASVMFRRD